MTLDLSMPHRRRPPPSPLEAAAVRKARIQLKAALSELEEIAPEGEFIVLDTVAQIVKILGGTARTAELADVSMTKISDSKRKGMLPTNTFDILRNALNAKGYTAPNALWGMKELPPDTEDRGPASKDD